MWTAQETGPHADLAVPLQRMESNEPRHEGRVDVVNTDSIFVIVASEKLKYQNTLELHIVQASCSLAVLFCVFCCASYFRFIPCCNPTEVKIVRNALALPTYLQRISELYML
jgi:hypothetical protein